MQDIPLCYGIEHVEPIDKSLAQSLMVSWLINNNQADQYFTDMLNLAELAVLIHVPVSIPRFLLT